VIKSSRMKLVGYVSHMGQWEFNTKFWSEILMGSNQLGDIVQMGL
jgi:hypothetical protein